MLRPLSETQKSVGHARRRRAISSAALTAASHSELLMLPSPHETNEMASRGHAANPSRAAAAAGSRCSIASARPTAC
jgi:hypothetical protein